MLQAVLFDLDGTLLQINSNAFIRKYLQEVSKAMVALIEPELLTKTLVASTDVMVQDRLEQRTNAEVFWADFTLRTGKSFEELCPYFEEYYANQFNKLSTMTKPYENAHSAVQKAVDLGLRIVLATNAVFPESAILDRMTWAGVRDMPWDFITTYENMHYCKPNPKYYLEVASRIGVDPQNCLMIGNDAKNDIVPAQAVSMRAFLITDVRNDKLTDDPGADGAGDLFAFIVWLDRLVHTEE